MKLKNYSNGDWYFGEFIEENKNGKGLFVKNNNLIYIGQWIKGNPLGQSVLVGQKTLLYKDQRKHFVYE